MTDFRRISSHILEVFQGHENVSQVFFATCSGARLLSHFWVSLFLMFYHFVSAFISLPPAADFVLQADWTRRVIGD